MAELTINKFKSEILNSISNYSITVVEAGTGAGKSTMIPLWLGKAGYEVVVTEPRRIAVRSVSKRVASLYPCEVGEEVGYQTAQDKKLSELTKILFATDGLQMIKEIIGVNSDKERVLVIDEVHEWNLNIEVLVSWVELLERLNLLTFKVVIMSATMDANRFKDFYRDVNIISVPGRLYPITKRERGESPEADVISLVKENRNILMFQPGKREIEESINILQDRLKDEAIILPLYGELSVEEQDKVFEKYDKPLVVVATNVAQTSITIPSITAVVDTGVERRIEVIDGVESLILAPISKADSKQRAGRAGRVAPGVYVNWGDTESQPDYPKAEIQRLFLSTTYLKLLNAGFRMEEMKFFNPISEEKIEDTIKELKGLNCIDESGNLTELGRKVSRLPLEVRNGIFITKAEEMGILSEAVEFISIMEADGITHHKNDSWKKLINVSTESDILNQYRLWKKLPTIDKKMFRDYGIIWKKVNMVKDKIHMLRKVLKIKRTENVTSIENKLIKALVAANMDSLFVTNYDTTYNSISKNINVKMSYESDVRHGDVLIGKVFKIQTKRGYLNLLTNITKVSLELLKELNCPYYKEKESDIYLDGSDELIKEVSISVGGVILKTEDRKIEPTKDIDLYIKAYKDKYNGMEIEHIIIKSDEEFYNIIDSIEVLEDTEKILNVPVKYYIYWESSIHSVFNLCKRKFYYKDKAVSVTNETLSEIREIEKFKKDVVKYRDLAASIALKAKVFDIDVREEIHYIRVGGKQIDRNSLSMLHIIDHNLDILLKINEYEDVVLYNDLDCRIDGTYYSICEDDSKIILSKILEDKERKINRKKEIESKLNEYKDKFNSIAEINIIYKDNIIGVNLNNKKYQFNTLDELDEFYKKIQELKEVEKYWVDKFKSIDVDINVSISNNGYYDLIIDRDGWTFKSLDDLKSKCEEIYNTYLNKREMEKYYNKFNELYNKAEAKGANITYFPYSDGTILLKIDRDKNVVKGYKEAVKILEKYLNKKEKKEQEKEFEDNPFAKLKGLI